MMEMEKVDEALKALREADAGRGAPEFLETRLRAAFREKHAPRPRVRWNLRWGWLGALATAAMALFIVWRLSAPAPVQAPLMVATKPPAPVITPAPKVANAIASTVPQKRIAPAPRRRGSAAQPKPIDAVTASARDDDFIALPYAPPLLPTDRTQVMRVRMPRQTLRQLGFPMNEERIFERIPADVLLGEDGIPRAIRIVNSR